jgi:hypothetical protein
MFDDPAGFRVGNMAAETDVALCRDCFIVLRPWATEPEEHFIWSLKGLRLTQVSIGLMSFDANVSFIWINLGFFIWYVLKLVP